MMETRMTTTNPEGNSPVDFAWAQEGGALTLRNWLDYLRASGRMATIDREVALEHELAAIAKKLDGKKAAMFMNTGGHAIPVVSGFMSRRSWIAEAMGVPEAELLARFRTAAEHPIAS